MRTAAGLWIRERIRSLRTKDSLKINLTDSSGAETGWLSISEGQFQRIAEIILEGK